MEQELFSAWTFWFLKRGAPDYQSSLEKSVSFSSLKEFATIWKGTKLGDLGNYFTNTETGEIVEYKETEEGDKFVMFDIITLFKDYIQPTWEDPHNSDGGEFGCVFLVSLAEAQDIYKKTVFALIGEKLPFSEAICGVRFCDKNKPGLGLKCFRLKVQFWLAFGEDPAKIDQFTREISKFYEPRRIEGKILFRSHATAA